MFGTGVFKVINSDITCFVDSILQRLSMTGAVLFPAPDNFARVGGLVHSDVVLQFLVTSHFTDRFGGRLTFLEN